LYNAYLTKPVRQSRLLDTIAEVMKRSKPEPSVLAVGGRFEGRFNQSRLKVLIAHDNELTRAVTEKTLQLLGYPFEVAHSGEELLEQSRRDHYDLIIMDADMPNVSGVETVRRMRRIKSDEDMPVVIGILSTDGIERQACLKAGMDDVMTRPLRTEDLQRKILYWMEDAAG
ncbi:MAG: response regulator, partial [Bacteroidota bacterium]